MAAVSDLMLRRPCINVSYRSTRRASWHQREMVPVRCVMACCVRVWCVCGEYTMRILQYSAVLGTAAATYLRSLISPPHRAACHVPSMTERLSLNRPPGSCVHAAWLPATSVPHRPSP